MSSRGEVGANVSHEGHGNHWGCVFKDQRLLMQFLPVLVERGRIVDRFEERGMADGATTAIAWPDTPLRGLSLISEERQNGITRQVLASAFPYAATGLRHRLVVKEILPWQSGIEAWIKASPPGDDGPSITFFDTRFYANQRLMKIGLEADFILAGLGYFAEVVYPEPVLITKEHTIRAMRAGTAGADDLSPIEVGMEGTAMLLPRDDYAPDEYEFHGPVKLVDTFDVFDRRMIKLTITVARLSDHNDSDIDIELFVGDHVWRSNERPMPGADVQGLLWLQGRLPA